MGTTKFDIGTLLAGTLLLAGLAGCSGQPLSSTPSTWLIENARIIDGSGAPPSHGAVRVSGQRIEAVGNLEPRDNERRIDAKGLALAPGFIDTHSHADAELRDYPDAVNLTSQGITTIVVGQDGESPFPLKEFFTTWERQPAAINLAAFSGHNTLRHLVMGDDFQRPARPVEITEMQQLLQQDLAAGALGLSTGLEYDPGIYSRSDEVLELARTVAAAGGHYISHMRSEDRQFESALNELLNIGRLTGIPVQISHFKLAMKPLWGTAEQVLAKLDAARAEGIDVTADVYPYEYWQSTLEVLFPERNFADLEAAREVLENIAPADGLLMSQYLPNPQLVGQTIADIAAARGTSEAQTLIDMIADAQAYSSTHSPNHGGIIGAEMVIGTSMHTDDVAKLLSWPFSNVCSDGSLMDRHPRGIGSFPKVLRWLVRETGRLSLQDAVHRMSLQAAQNVGLQDRGQILPGAFADLVLFDPATISDRATPAEPMTRSLGVHRVWVNGQLVYSQGNSTAARPGQILRRPPRN